MSAAGPGPTGTAGSVSDVGAFDMVGNLYEWVADWVPLSTDCALPLSGTDDENCLAGASTTAGPGALIRGGAFFGGAAAGVFAVAGGRAPLDGDSSLGFRAARLLSLGTLGDDDAGGGVGGVEETGELLGVSRQVPREDHME